MATLTLTLDDALLARLRSGEPLTLTATLRERKPKSSPLPDHLRGAYQQVVDLWAKWQPDVSPALAWKALRPFVEADAAEALDAMSLALDWNRGRRYLPLWFTKEYEEWTSRTGMDLFAQEDERAAYRRRFGLGA